MSQPSAKTADRRMILINHPRAPSTPESACRRTSVGRTWARLILMVGAACALGACAGVGHYDAAEPPGVDLAGTWRLNAAASDDSRKALEKLRPRRPSSTSASIDQGPQQGRRRRQGSQQDPNALPDDFEPRSAIPLIPDIDVLRNEVMAIRQRPDAFVIDYGTSVRSFTPGAKSVVSVPGGVGDQSTGWKGKDYVVDIRSQLDVSMSQSYSLSNKNGRQLIVKIHISGSGIPTVDVKRVYDPTTTDSPRSLPILD